MTENAVLPSTRTIRPSVIVSDEDFYKFLQECKAEKLNQSKMAAAYQEKFKGSTQTAIARYTTLRKFFEAQIKTLSEMEQTDETKAKLQKVKESQALYLLPSNRNKNPKQKEEDRLSLLIGVLDKMSTPTPPQVENKEEETVLQEMQEIASTSETEPVFEEITIPTSQLPKKPGDKTIVHVEQQTLTIEG